MPPLAPAHVDIARVTPWAKRRGYDLTFTVDDKSSDGRVLEARIVDPDGGYLITVDGPVCGFSSHDQRVALAVVAPYQSADERITPTVFRMTMREWGMVLDRLEQEDHPTRPSFDWVWLVLLLLAVANATLSLCDFHGGTPGWGFMHFALALFISWLAWKRV